MNLSKNKNFKVALYIRVSTEEQAENPEGSIKNQEERLRQVVRHEQEKGNSYELAGVFVDAGLSAKDMNRPNLQKLLKAIKQGEVNMVMVTELSRLSRNTKDFCEMWEFFQSVGCEFHSLREHFDTTTAAGELMLKSFANFAEFERRQTAERIAASFKVRAERGLYNGGPVAVGYKLSSVKGKLDIDESESIVVKEAFKAYLKEDSLTSACKLLNEKGYTLRKRMQGSGWLRNGHFKVETLHTILTNKAYIGVKVFNTKEGKQESKATWEAIIDELTFKRVQERLNKNYRTKKPDAINRYPFLLTEVIYCGVCGDKLCGKSAYGKTKKHPYYEHSRRTKVQRGLAEKIYNCDPHRISATKAEDLVWNDVEQLLMGKLASELLQGVKNKQSKSFFDDELKRLKNKTYSINAQVESLTIRLSELPTGLSATPIYKQMEKLEIAKRSLEEKYIELKREELDTELPVDSVTYQNFLLVLRQINGGKLTYKWKQKIIVSLIEKIEIFPDRMEISFGLGSSKITREVALATSLIESKMDAKRLELSNELKSFMDKCSTSLTNGGTTVT